MCRARVVKFRDLYQGSLLAEPNMLKSDNLYKGPILVAAPPSRNFATEGD